MRPSTVKHARARHVDVHLEAHGGSLVLEIADDGIGFDPDQSFPGYLGLRSIRERARGSGACSKSLALAVEAPES